MSDGASSSGRLQSVLLVFFLGVVMASAMFYLTRQEEEKRIRAEFERRADVQYEVFRESLNRYQELLRVTRSFMANSAPVSREQFRGFAEDVMARFTGIQALEWVPRVSANERAAYEEAARRDGLTDFQFFELSPKGERVPAAPRAEHLPLYYIEPAKGNETAFGYDVTTAATHKELAEAADSNRVTGTQRFRLVQERGDQHGWILALPVFRGPVAETASPAARREALAGYVQGVFRVDDLMTAVWRKAPFVGLDTLVIDGSAPATNRYFYFNPAAIRKGPVTPPTEEALRGGLFHEVRAQLAGREWIFLFRPAPEWLAAQYTGYPQMILVAGVLFSALLTAYVRNLSQRAELVKAQVKERTASLKQANEQLEQEVAERRRAETERAKYQREHDELFERLQVTLQNMPVGCILNDADFKFTYWNPAAERIFGYRAEEVRGRHPFEFITPISAQAQVLETFQKLKAGQLTAHRYGENVTKDGRTILCEWNNALLRRPDGSFIGILSMCQDITERHRLEAERLEMQHNIQETQKLESLGVLAGGIAHDFNNLLTGILGNASLARMELPRSATVHEYLKQIESASLRAADLCKQMLAYSGKGRFVVENINLSAVVEDTKHLLHLSISKKAGLEFHLAENLLPVLADVSQVRQILMNLVINASEAVSERGGLVTVRTGMKSVTRAYLGETFLAPDLPEGQYAFLEVADNGCGMKAEIQARIFEPFFTTKFTGRGLGLAAVLGIVRGHKGALKVRSEEGRGSTFEVLFPCLPEAKTSYYTSPATPPKTTPPGKAGSGTILVVDDEESVRTVVGLMLEAFGYTPVVAKDGYEALEKFAQNSGNFALVLLDLTMPRLDGEETFRELRRLRSDVRVVLMSGFSEQDAMDRFAGKGLSGFLQKPFKPEMLREKIAGVLNLQK